MPAPSLAEVRAARRADVVRARRLAEQGDVTALTATLVDICYHASRKDLASVLDALSEDGRERLARTLTTALDEATAARREQAEPMLWLLRERLPESAAVHVAEWLLARIIRNGGHHRWSRVSALVTRAVAVMRNGGRLLLDQVVALRRSGVAGDPEFAPYADQLADPVLNPGESWADRVMAVTDHDTDWLALVRHAGTARGSKPSGKWRRRAATLVDAIGGDAVRDTVLEWLRVVGPQHSGGDADPYNAPTLRGLIWLLAVTPPHPETPRVLNALVRTALRKVPGKGPWEPGIANSVVRTLSVMDGAAATAELGRLATQVTYRTTLKLIDNALVTRATALGLTREEIAELSVPTYDFTEVGRRVAPVGDATAEITAGAGQARLTWRNASGKVVKSPPAAVRRDHPDAVKELKASVKDLGRTLTAQSERLDRMFLDQRVWAYRAWRERFLDHPVVGTLARRLVWLVGDQPCGYADGALRTADDAPVTPSDTAEVRLWHPIDRHLDEVLTWRNWLDRHQITQPFKQAHREVYRLTDAERQTRTYSNRYAGHILRQHQFHALTATRGWRNRLRLMVDDSYPPATRQLRLWGVRAEFRIEGTGEDYGVDTLDSGSYLRISTDQVRFYPADAPEHFANASGGGYVQYVPAGAEPVEPLPLEEIPPLVFSEVMRDIDLYVGVASVGNDPTWQDGGPEGRYREYWHHFSFGELSGTAETRREVLERLLPRLAIADRCALDGRFLRVRGDLRTYRIHLGSSNILMSPGDEYLCIVPGRGADADPAGLSLPFEGDRVLALILSKAMLLARDTAITDTTIVSQIRP